MVTLKESRRVRNDTLASLADAIKRGDGEEFGPFLQEKEGMLSMLCDWVDEYYPSFYSTLPDARALLQGFEKFRILSCLRQGPWGVDEINRTLLDRFQANCPREGWWVIPILVTRNDDATQLYNGDMGVLIKKIDPFNREMKWGREDYALFSGRDPLPVFGLPPFEYAYCLTIHKSQGSEYENVVVLVPEGSDRFGKEILYTAVTRAKSDLKVFAQEGMIEKMIAKASKKKSGLTARLQQRCKVFAN